LQGNLPFAVRIVAMPVTDITGSVPVAKAGVPRGLFAVSWANRS